MVVYCSCGFPDSVGSSLCELGTHRCKLQGVHCLEKLLEILHEVMPRAIARVLLSQLLYFREFSVCNNIFDSQNCQFFLTVRYSFVHLCRTSLEKRGKLCQFYYGLKKSPSVLTKISPPSPSFLINLPIP